MLIKCATWIEKQQDVAIWDTMLLKQKYQHFDEIFITGCCCSCQHALTTPSAASDRNSINMTTFPFQ